MAANVSSLAGAFLYSKVLVLGEVMPTVGVVPAAGVTAQALFSASMLPARSEIFSCLCQSHMKVATLL